MAQKVEVFLVDDLDGGAADETVVFGLDGTRYEIDLSTAHANELRAELAQYVRAARKEAGRLARAADTAQKGMAGKASIADIREWARENGHDIKERGRVPAALVAEYHAATGR
jgi:hypothetical protein